MTRARALKQIIRDRAAKTGERYTAARRHVLSAFARQETTELRRDDKRSATGAGLSRPSTVKGSLSDKSSIAKTGHDLEHWFAVLDRFGAVEKGHTAAARHLYEDHKVPGWHSQGITVAYERACGVRAVNQRCDGEYEVSVSKVIARQAPAIIKAITNKRMRQAWLIDVDAELAKALVSAVDSKSSKGFVVRPDGLARYRYKWGDTSVQFYMTPMANKKMSVVVTNAKLADGAVVEARRRLWRTALTALAARLSD